MGEKEQGKVKGGMFGRLQLLAGVQRAINSLRAVAAEGILAKKEPLLSVIETLRPERAGASQRPLGEDRAESRWPR